MLGNECIVTTQVVRVALIMKVDMVAVMRLVFTINEGTSLLLHREPWEDQLVTSQIPYVLWRRLYCKPTDATPLPYVLWRHLQFKPTDAT